MSAAESTLSEHYPISTFFDDFPRLTEINWHDERVKDILTQHIVDRLDVEDTLNRIETISGVRTTKRILQQRTRRQRESLIKSGVLNKREITVPPIRDGEESSPKSLDSYQESLEGFDFNFGSILSPNFEFTSLETFPDEFVLTDFFPEALEGLEPVFEFRQVKNTLLPITMRYPVNFDPLYTKALLTEFYEVVHLAFYHLNTEENYENEENSEFLASENHINFFVQFLFDMKIFHLIFSRGANLQDPKMNGAYNALVQIVVNWIMNDTSQHRNSPVVCLPPVHMTRFQFRRLLIFIDSQMNFLIQLIENYLKLNPQFEEVVVKSRILISFVYTALGGIAQNLVDRSINRTLEAEWTATMEKKSINWKDPKVKLVLDAFLDKKLPLKTIPEFAVYVNKICGTNIALSTIRNKIYQQQRERRLLLQGMQQAIEGSNNGSAETNPAPPPDPEPLGMLQALQAVPVMFKDQAGEILQAFALVSDATQVLNLINEASTNGVTSAVPVELEDPIAGPSGINSNGTSSDSQNNNTIDCKIPFTLVKDSEVILVDNCPDEFAQEEEDTKLNIKDGPPSLEDIPLPSEFLQHFDANSFKVDMGTLKQLSLFVREKLDYLKTAAEIYPHHNSFLSSNIDAFKRNLDVIQQAGEYFDPLLAFEDDPKFFPDALSEIGVALTICSENSTGMLDQFFEPMNESLDKLPGSTLTKRGMLNLVVILNGILMEAESLIGQYELMKIENKNISKMKMMMLTLQFSRFYRLAGHFAKAAIERENSEKVRKLADDLNRIKMIRLDQGNPLFDVEEAEILPGTMNFDLS
ncbi:hypothetical protein FO519_006862 [Halicephalobus sp. NKZ332]|nr:hypothetical protein FO519_006862 [Halicephalobus sp. NKZ332]